ncbi:hypothetical protein ACLQ2R_10020 [Streptosporangium sp. DT93]|uniref:hypothetical protein n=1 Tax=Streptosporangium sp. DT93 TaxID=3393428 RepID=UPI003CEDA4EA
MTPPLLGQRSRAELIAELYDRHAAGLFAYAHDQLGDAGSASDVLVAVLSNVLDTEPPRAALYALARRAIYQRDIVYSPPLTGLDPVAALVQRVLGDLRTHQREVLYLSGVCEMDAAELSWVLDVAADTADELTVSACRRFAQSLGLALASARIPGHLAEVFGALAVAPVRDVLNLAPWATPAARLRSEVLGPRASIAPTAGRPMSPLVRQLWPTTPQWPLPSPENGGAPGPPPGPPGLSLLPGLGDPAGTVEDRFPDPFAPPDRDAVSAHEASTQPIPKIRDSVLSELDAAALRPRRRLQRPRPRRAAPLSAPVAGDVLDDAPARQEPLTPETRAARAYTDRLVAAAPRDGERDTERRPDEVTLLGAARVSPAEALRTPPADLTDLSVTARVSGVYGDVLDDPPGTRPLPGWPLQTDQLDALAARDADERERRARSSFPGAAVPPAPAAPAFPTPVPASPPVPAPAPVIPIAPRAGHASHGSHGSPVEEMPTALPHWTPRPDHLSTPANQERFRLPGWVVREDHLSGDRPSGAPLRPVPAHRTPTSYEAQHGRGTTAPADVSGTAPMPSVTPVAPMLPPDPVVPPGSLWSGRAQAPRPAPAARTASSLSGRAAPRRRGCHASHGRKARTRVSHHDWAWEVAGFVIAVAIAMIVFFAVPMMTAP